MGTTGVFQRQLHSADWAALCCGTSVVQKKKSSVTAGNTKNGTTLAFISIS